MKNSSLIKIRLFQLFLPKKFALNAILRNNFRQEAPEKIEIKKKENIGTVTTLVNARF